MSIETTRITDYFDRYAASLTRFDAEASAELWSTPGMVVDDRFSGALDSREEMATGLKQSYPIYRELGLGSVDYELIDENRLSDALVLVRVRWLFLDGDGELLTDSNSYYLLRDEESGLRACVCIETDSMQKLQALADAKGVDLTPPSA